MLKLCLELILYTSESTAITEIGNKFIKHYDIDITLFFQTTFHPSWASPAVLYWVISLIFTHKKAATRIWQDFVCKSLNV